MFAKSLAELKQHAAQREPPQSHRGVSVKVLKSLVLPCLLLGLVFSAGDAMAASASASSASGSSAFGIATASGSASGSTTSSTTSARAFSFSSGGGTVSTECNGTPGDEFGEFSYCDVKP